MVILDIFIVNVAAPSLRAELGASESDVQWVVAAYVLTSRLGHCPQARAPERVGRCGG